MVANRHAGIFLSGLLWSALSLAPVAGEALAQESGDSGGFKRGRVTPSQGIELYQRMGAQLPPPPPEKPFTGVLDEAYGAYQRGAYKLALELASVRAENGDAPAQTLIAEMLSRGLGTARDAKAAALWYRKAAEGGDPAAMHQYGLLLAEGRHVKRDRALGDDFIRRAAEAGHAGAQFQWGQILISQNPGESGFRLALPFFEKAAEKGLPDAQYAVAQLYVALKDLPEEKQASARSWLERAAKASHDTAQLDMGLWLVSGVAGGRDYERGFRWMRAAALRGNVVAQNKLAHLYVNALGTRPDPVEAAKWYLLSRGAGLSDLELEDFYLGIDEGQQQQAQAAAQRFRADRGA